MADELSITSFRSSPTESASPIKSTPLINTFGGGELDPEMDVRADIDRYEMGCRTVENFMPILEGGATRVPGTEYIIYAKRQAPSY